MVKELDSARGSYLASWSQLWARWDRLLGA